MECVQCNEFGFGRAIVRLGVEGNIGAVCDHCVHQLYGDVLQTPLWQHESGCIFCADEGEIALPLMECHIERDGRDDFVEYHIDEATPTLCASHAKDIHPTLAKDRATAKQRV